MSKCANCGKELVVIEGKEPKLYCNDACRKAYKRKQHRTEATPDIGQTATPDTKAKSYIGCVPRTKDTEVSVNAPDIRTVDNTAPMPANFGQPDCECRHCDQNRQSSHRLIINHGPYKSAAELAFDEVNRVSLPGDVDYIQALDNEWHILSIV